MNVSVVHKGECDALTPQHDGANIAKRQCKIDDNICSQAGPGRAFALLSHGLVTNDRCSSASVRTGRIQEGRQACRPAGLLFGAVAQRSVPRPFKSETQVQLLTALIPRRGTTPTAGRGRRDNRLKLPITRGPRPSGLLGTAHE